MYVRKRGYGDRRGMCNDPKPSDASRSSDREYWVRGSKVFIQMRKRTGLDLSQMLEQARDSKEVGSHDANVVTSCITLMGPEPTHMHVCKGE